MSDIIVSGYPSVSIYGKPRASSTAYALASAINFAKPYLSDDIGEFANTLQSDYEGNATYDINLSKEQIIDALKKYNVLYIDHQDLVDEANTSGNFDALRHEAAAANRNSVVQFFLVQHGNKLALAIDNTSTDANAPLSVDGPAIRAWAKDEPYGFVRIGFQDNKPVGKYVLDPVTSALPFEKPTPLTWTNVTSCQLLACIFVLDSNVQELPPPDFRYFGGMDASGNPITNTWPLVEKSFDPTPVIEAVQQVLQYSNQSYSDEITALNTRVNTLNAVKQQSDMAFMDILKQLGYKDNTVSSSLPAPSSTDASQPVPSSSNTTSAAQPTSSDAVPVTALTTQPLEQQGIL